MVGKGNSSSTHRDTSYYSTPYEKKDPSSFAPPPRTKRYGEGESPAAPEPRHAAVARPDLPVRQSDNEEEKTYERGPFVANKTGVDLSKYPEPPGRRTGLTTSASSASSASQNLSKPKPNLPPRLPPRTLSEVAATSTASASDGFLNHSALERLGRSGISVPGFGIGSESGAKPPPALPNRNSSAPLPPSVPQSGPTTGTTWAEKQAAVKTANQLRTNPNAVSLADVRGATLTAKNFQARHGDEVASGLQSAQQVNQKYGLAGKMEQLSVASGKKPPPLPTAKKIQGSSAPPPPIPGNKPKPV